MEQKALFGEVKSGFAALAVVLYKHPAVVVRAVFFSGINVISAVKDIQELRAVLCAVLIGSSEIIGCRSRFFSRFLLSLRSCFCFVGRSDLCFRSPVYKGVIIVVGAA